MKKAFILLICLMMVISSFVTLNVFANDDIKILIDDKSQTYDQMPVIVSDRTLVPLRGIFEALGANVEWHDETKTIMGYKGDKTIVLQVGNTIAIMNNKSVALDVPPSIINSRTMVPVRFISEALGANVEWIGDSRTVVITSAEKYAKVKEENRSKNGEVVLDNSDLIKKTIRSITGGAEATLDYVEDKLYVNVKKTTAKDMDVQVSFRPTIGGIVKQSDVCLITFKARLISGGDEEGGYVKVWAQSENGTKSIFARTKVGSEWAECYLPFVGINNMSNMGFRLGGAVQELEIKDFNLINYGPDKNVKALKSTALRGDNTVASVYIDDAPVADDAPQKEETPSAPSVSAPATTNEGTVIIDSTQFKKNSTHTGKGCADFKFNDDVLNINVHTLPEKDLQAISTVTISLKDLINQSDVCLITFKARLISGGTDGIGYIKAFVQNDSNVKALFARTDVKSEWTECSLPFVGIANMNNMGIRYGGAVQNIEIKDFKVINYGPNKNVKSLKSTALRGDNTVAPVFIDDIPAAN